MLSVVAAPPDLLWVLLVPIAGLVCCAAIGTIIFVTWARLRRR
jgi:hypothetical protein